MAFASNRAGAVECGGQQTQPTGYAGGATLAASTIPAATYCVVFTAGSTFDKTTTSAVTCTGGVEMTGPIGIDRSARTEYATAELTFHFSQRRSLCGTDALLASATTAARRIVAGLP